MGQITILYWRDIPAQVIARQGRQSAKRVLSARFAEAIDRAAMRAGLTGTDAYLQAWRRSPASPCGDDLEAAAAAVAARLEDAFTDQLLRTMVVNGGEAPVSPV